MNVYAATALLLVFQLIHHAQLIIFNRKDTSNDDGSQEEKCVNGSSFDFLYWNSILGNKKSMQIEFGNESSVLDYWIEGLPLKVITHGWLASDENCNGVFVIKTAYIDTGGYNVFSVDWSTIAVDIIYKKPAFLTLSVGRVIAEFLDRLVAHTGTRASDIHLIGHSLGAHVMGSCGSHFKSGKIGRITGLDPACPGFQFIPLQRKHLCIDDGEFVDVIHTAGGTLGYSDSLGHVDFFPNAGIAPQPGCGLLLRVLSFILCSHSRAYDLYADSVYNKKSLTAIQCPTWLDYTSEKCKNNTNILMGHDTLSSARGTFFSKTNHTSPFGLS